MTAICDACGLTPIYLRTITDKKYTGSLCVKKKESESRQKCRKCYTPRSGTYKPSKAILAQQNSQQIIDAYKVRHGCKRCGYNADALGLELHFSVLDESEFTESKLLNFPQKRFLHALKISEIYCVDCHSLVHAETASIK
jgi:hypothetical protein